MYVTATYFCKPDITILRQEPTGAPLAHFTGDRLVLYLDQMRAAGVKVIRLGCNKTDEFKKIDITDLELKIVDPDPGEV